MSLQSFATWLYATPLATTIRDEPWIIPSVQSVHILAIAVVVGSALVSDLRLAGVLATDTLPNVVVRRYLRWMWVGLAVLLATGSLMAIGEPDRVLTNFTFWLKMGLVVVACLLTWYFRRPLLHPEFQLDSARWRPLVKPAAWLSLAIWICVIFCGRWIAYTI